MFLQVFKRLKMQKLISAINFAAHQHRFQRRKDSDATPYINHPIEVLHLLSENGIIDENTLMAAVLHDTVEDTKTSLEQIRELFGEKVANIVAECTDNKKLDKVSRKKIQLEHARHISRGAKCVKLADKYSNCVGLLDNPPKHWSKEEIYGYAVWSFAIFQHLKGQVPSLDEKMQKVFKGLQIDENINLEMELEKYYSRI